MTSVFGRLTQSSRRFRSPLFLGLGGALLTIIIIVAIGEALGWPFLAQPAQRILSDKLHRQVSFGTSVTPPDNAPTTTKAFSMRFIGGLRVTASRLDIAAPDWSKKPHFLSARDITLELRYVDLWRAYRGEPLRVQRLEATTLDGNLERLADGRASWQFREPKTSPPLIETDASTRPMTPVFAKLQVASGVIRYQDAPLDIDLEARLSLTNGASVVGPPPGGKLAVASGTASTAQSADAGKSVKSGNSDASRENLFQINATGKYRGLDAKLELRSVDVLPWSAADAAAVSVPLTLNVTVGRAKLDFKGTATDASHLGGFTGRYSLQGPSLAAVGDPLGVTLPTTAAFRMDGAIVRQSDTWSVVVDKATIGTSRLNGAFTFETARPVPLLTGRLGGARLILADLGPSIGVPSGTDSKKVNGKVLPDRPFDLKALRSMDANVLIDMGELDLGSKLLETLRPLHSHLLLKDGVLTLDEIEAHTGQGNFGGKMSLDGRALKAIWIADLRWDGVQLERAIHQTRPNNAPPFVSGRLHGGTTLQGVGRSTAEILGSLKGKYHTELSEGAVSHLGVEIAGLDVAGALGVLFKGDDALPIQCAVADLVVDNGIFRPRVMVIDTENSAIWVEGSLSLATESLDLHAVVMPKDFSPLTLRTPLRVTGKFGNPEVSLDKAPLGRKLASAFLLGLINPLAALLPLVDTGDEKAASRGAEGCRKLMERAAPKKTSKARAK